MSENRVEQLKYSISKQLADIPDLMVIRTNYGEVPLSADDAVAVQDLLKKRFKCKIRAYEINT